ncbi:MAG: ABC transporter substrate-binding protein, partial [Dehalococcoidia bacterium]|nr:ABC transporter substrate-binding protein [Dehalococcoidia bacterium]
MSTRSAVGTLISAAIIVIALFLGACSTISSPPTSSLPVTESKPYGSLTIASEFGAGLLDPPKGDSNSFVTLGAAIFDTLLSPLPNGKPGPRAAERWEISPDGMTHSFYLRKGIKFHNGDDLTAADVRFSVERMMKPESIISEASIWRAAVAIVVAKDYYTVVIHMKTPQFDLLRATEVAMTAIMPKKYIEEKGEDYFKNNLVGSGPFKVVKYEPGIRLELEASE